MKYRLIACTRLKKRSFIMRSILSHLAYSRWTHFNVIYLMLWEPVSQLQCTLSVWLAPSLGGALLGCLGVSFELNASQLFCQIWGRRVDCESITENYRLTSRGRFRSGKGWVSNQPAESGFWPENNSQSPGGCRLGRSTVLSQRLTVGQDGGWSSASRGAGTSLSFDIDGLFSLLS